MRFLRTRDHRPLRSMLLQSIALALMASTVGAASLPAAKPAEVGMSAERLKRVRETLQPYIDAQQVSGAVTVAARRGRIVHFESQGVMDFETKKPMPKDAVFRTASMTKPVTAVAVLMLVEEGKLRLNDPVSKFIPQFKTLQVVAPITPPPGLPPLVPQAPRLAEPQFYTVPASREITIRDLLTHTSGFMSGLVPPREAAKVERKPTDTLADYIPKLAQVPLEFQPGERWSYSPVGAFNVLGRIVEIASGQTYDEFLRARIFEPLGMKDTNFAVPQPNEARLVTLYQRGEKGLTKAADQYPANFLSGSLFSGAAGLMSTAEDFLKFGQMLLDGGELGGRRLLSPRTVELMHSTFVKEFRGPGLTFGLSVQIVDDPLAAGYRVGKGSYGWSGAYGTNFWVDPQEQMVGVLMVQTSNNQLSRDFENALMQAIVD